MILTDHSDRWWPNLEAAGIDTEELINFLSIKMSDSLQMRHGIFLQLMLMYWGKMVIQQS